MKPLQVTFLMRAFQQYPTPGYYTYDLPTPMASDQGSFVTRMGRNGQVMAPNGPRQAVRENSKEKSRISNTSRAKRTTKQKGEKAKIPKIDAPLSELTKNMDDIPVKDMNEWVTRSAEIRGKEVDKRHGYVTRPMNSFMLYRSAYAERTKIWCLQNNHQVVSSVSGESWPLEPPEIRDKYNEYARIERDNHAKAHPGYKFTPAKTQTSGRKRKGASDDIDEEEPSDLDDPDYEWRPKAGKRTRTKRAKASSQDAGYPSSNTSLDDLGLRGWDPNVGQNMSSYQFTNPGKPLPKQIDVDALYNQYYQTNTYPSSMGSNVEDVVIRKTETPNMQYGTAQPLVGLPGIQHYALLDQHVFDNSPAALNDPQVDPLLLAYDNDYPGHQNDFVAQRQIPDDQDPASLFGTPSQMSNHQDGLPLHPESDQWQFESHAGHSEGNLDDFEDFMGMHNNR